MHARSAVDSNLIEEVKQTGGALHVSVAPSALPFTNTAPAITTSSQEVLAANANRRYLLVQNKDATNSIYVRFGAAATAAAGVEVKAGSYYEPLAAPTNSVNIIGAAANSNVVLVEG